jgi:HD-like signal output (HDOD) protein/CheY-like chemotaxis protein
VGKRRILFVDDEPNVLAGLRRGLRRQHASWEMEFAAGPEEALVHLEKNPFDVVVSDMRMPGMDGGQLLAEVRRLYPQTARIILSGHADRASIVSAIGPTQQYLAKPCDIEVMVATVDRVLGIRDLVTSPRMRALLGSVETLPKPPSIYEEMMSIASDEDCGLKDVAAVVENDMATTAELLRLVNSAFFGLPTRVPNVHQAISYLGLETIQALALAGAVFRSDTSTASGLDLKAVSDRGLAIGTLAKKIACHERWELSHASDLFLAGLMHETGLLVLTGAHPEKWAELRRDQFAGLDERDAREREVFGCSVTEASAYLLGLWGFSETVVHSIAGQPARPDDLSATSDAQLLSVARRLVDYGPGDVRPTSDGFVHPDRLASWVPLTGGDENKADCGCRRGKR